MSGYTVNTINQTYSYCTVFCCICSSGDRLSFKTETRIIFWNSVGWTWTTIQSIFFLKVLLQFRLPSFAKIQPNWTLGWVDFRFFANCDMLAVLPYSRSKNLDSKFKNLQNCTNFNTKYKKKIQFYGKKHFSIFSYLK